MSMAHHLSLYVDPLQVAVAVAECRICQEEDDIAKLDTPCSCSGSLKYVHHKCVQRWCDEKGDLICEICRQNFKGDYTAPTLSLPFERIRIEIGGNWGINGYHQHDTSDPDILAIATEYEEYRAANANSIACCRSAALILMTLLLLRHVLSITDAINDSNMSEIFTIFMIRATGFLFPCYVMVLAMNRFRQRRQHQGVAIATTEVETLLEAGGQAYI